MTSRGKPRRRWRRKGLALALVLMAGFYLTRTIYQRFQKTYPATAFYTVKRADMLISIVEEGALRTLNETVVRSGLEGLNRIIYLVPEGSYVEKGDLLVELDSSGLKDRLNEQELLYQERLFQTAQAKGNLNIQRSLMESQIKDAELRLENAQLDFEKYRDADAPLLIKTIEARTSVLSEQVRIASERAVRTDELFKAGNATRSEVEADSLTLKREQLALGQYQEDLRLIKKYDRPNQLRLLQSNAEQAKAELDRLRQRTSNEVAQVEADLKTSQGALDYMEEGLEVLRQRLASTKIMAPQNGLVVYAQVSPFQSMGGEERRRDEGRFRGNRTGGGGGAGGGDFRGGGRRGGRSNVENGSGTGTSVSSASETVASGNQRIASAVSGSSVTGTSGESGGTSGGGSGTGTSGGGRSSGGSGSSGASGGGQSVSSAAGAFASYPSMRPSSLFGASTATNSPTGNAGASSAGQEATGVSTGGQNNSFGVANQSGFRGNSQGSRDFGNMEIYGTPGILEEGTMVRQRQELIRLPDVSKMLAEFKVEESRVRQVRPGMTAYINVQNIPHRRFRGTVRRVAVMPDAQSSWMNPDKKVFPADILVEEEMPILKPGVSVTVEVVMTNLTKVLSVPIQTVARWKGENVCFVRRGSRVSPVAVTTGWFNDAFVEVTSGLREGDRVLLAPASDEEMEAPEAEQTNKIESASPATPTGTEEPAAEGRRSQRRNTDEMESEASTERPRNRPGGSRRSQRAQDSPE